VLPGSFGSAMMRERLAAKGLTYFDQEPGE
jgi:hypothetical protein